MAPPWIVGLLLVAAAPAGAQDATRAPADPGEEIAGPSVTDPAGDGLVISLPLGERPFDVTILGYVETGFTWAFAQPWNGVIAWRGFDNRHATFSLSNVALGTRLQYRGVYVAAMLQSGRTPDTYYLAEPVAPPVAGVAGSSAATYRFLQEAYVGWSPSLGAGAAPSTLAIEGGLFLSPIGIESMAIRSNRHWSRSNLFFGLPFYLSGYASPPGGAPRGRPRSRW